MVSIYYAAIHMCICGVVSLGWIIPVYSWRVNELEKCYTKWCYYIATAGCREPTPPSRGSIENFQNAAEGATITYSCSQGSQMSAVCTNTTWRPDPATLQCREPGE